MCFSFFYLQRFLHSSVYKGMREGTMRQSFPAEIIERAQRGDAAAFSEIIERFQVSVYNLCYRMLSHNAGDAEDAAQEVFLKVWKNIGRFDANRTFSTWVLSIATNHCIDLIRKKRVSTIEIDETLEEILPDSIATPKQELAQKERSGLIRRILDGLSETDRAIVVLRYWDELPDREIAAALGLSESAVKSRLFRARKQLIQIYQQTQEHAWMEAVV